MGTDGVSEMGVDVRLVQGADGPKLALKCQDRTSTVPLRQLLVALRSVADSVVGAAVERERSAGREISCKAGCAACCRHLVLLSISEAQQLRELLAGMDEASRRRVMIRFEEAISKLGEGDLLARLQDLSNLPREELKKLATDYIALRIPCPFLEDERCSIYPIRPLICRQFLVTSAPIHCADPSPETVEPLALAANVFGALLRIEARQRGIPLVLAPYLNLSEDDSRKTVPAWMSLLLEQIKKIREERTASEKPRASSRDSSEH